MCSEQLGWCAIERGQCACTALELCPFYACAEPVMCLQCACDVHHGQTGGCQVGASREAEYSQAHS